MSIVPPTRLGKLEFYEAHLPPWAASPTAIGLTAGLVTELTTAVESCRAAYNDHLAAQSAAKAATTKFYNAVRFMHNDPTMGADMIDQIKAFAANTNNPDVYAIAQIPPPATPGITPPPGTPTNFTVGLLENGALQLNWKCSNPTGTTGTIYEVFRRTGGAGAFTYVGATGVKSFVDETIPANSGPATYQVTGVRSTQRGNPAQFTVNFGIEGPGIAQNTVSEIKMAA